MYIGQEAITAGMMTAIKTGDKVITAYRDHGHALAMGVSANAVMAELFGKETGCTGGKGGSMHMFSKEHNFVGGHGIVGAQIPMGAGLAFAEQYNNTGNVSLTFFGDGAARQGALHEAYNMAMLWKLPAVFICENNQYAMGTSVNRSSSEDQLFRRGESFRIPGIQDDIRFIRGVLDQREREASFTLKKIKAKLEAEAAKDKANAQAGNHGSAAD